MLLPTTGEAPQALTLFETPAATEDTPPTSAQQTGRRCPSPRTSPEHPLAEELRPRQRLREAGPEALSGAELLAILLGGEARRALQLAGEVISRAGGLSELRRASYHELMQGATLTEAKACVVLAAVELARRLGAARGPERPSIFSPSDVHALLGSRMRDLDREHLVVVVLDTKNRVLATPTVSGGTLSSSVVHAREVFKPAIQAGAASVILAHNHPSNNLQPSPEDCMVTKRIAEAGELLQIEVLDHVILGESYFSLKEHGMF